MFINHHQRAVGEFTVGVTVQRGNHFLEAIRRHRIIAGGDIDILALRLFQALIPGRVRSLARPLGDAHALLLLGQALDEFPRAIIRETVENKQLPILKSLAKDAVKTFPQKGKRIKVGQAN